MSKAPKQTRSSTERINVTKSFLPPFEEYEEYLRRIWTSNQLTNQGPLLIEFEQKIRDYLKVKNFHFVNNGTMALQLAIRALEITDSEIITTPFSYVATVSSILWERCTPVFVDIDPDTFCLDAAKIEAVITPKTKAIMPVHVFGSPCDVDKIKAIAMKHNLKIIYDGAHAFGVKYKRKSLLSYGDISTSSFHATKLFHAIEGGGLIVKDKKISDKLELTKRFGHTGDEHYMLGINAKASEMQAAMGLCNFKYVDRIIGSRKKVFELYNNLLQGSIKTLKINPEAEHNYSYYPVVFKTETALLGAVRHLEKDNIFARRYFYPSLNKLPYLSSTQDCPISEDISKRVICLPLYPGLQSEIIEKISGTILAHAA